MGMVSFNPETQIKEYKRTCDECGTIWHVLDSREKELARQAEQQANDCNQGMQECGYCNQLMNQPSKKQLDRRAPTVSEELVKLRICPKCYCSNFKEEVIIHEKK